MSWFDDLPPDVYLDQFVAHNDGENYDLVAQVPGPAGAVDVELRDGVTIWVDFVESSRPTSFAVQGTSVPPVFEHLIGWQRSEDLDDHLRSRSKRPRRIELDGEIASRIGEFRNQPSLNRFPVSQTASELGSVAVLRSIGEDDGFDDVTRALALLESVQFQERVDSEIVIERPVDELLDEAAELLEGGDGAIRAIASADRYFAADVSKQLTVLARGRSSIRRAAELLRVEPEQLGRDALLAEREAEWTRPKPSFSATRPFEPSVELSPGGLLTARFDATAVGSWLRVVDAGPMVLLALVPVMEEDGLGVARAVLGAGFRIDGLDLEVTDRPLPEPTATVDRIARAVALGRAAAVAMSEHTSASIELWLECADAWKSLGDNRRATLARRYASQGRSTWREPFWAERAHHLLHSTTN